MTVTSQRIYENHSNVWRTLAAVNHRLFVEGVQGVTTYPDVFNRIIRLFKIISEWWVPEPRNPFSLATH